jgi:hypothetical protein
MSVDEATRAHLFDRVEFDFPRSARYVVSNPAAPRFFGVPNLPRLGTPHVAPDNSLRDYAKPS